MQHTRDPTAKLPSAPPFAGASPPPYHHHHYGTFSPPPPPPVAAAAYDPSLKGRSAQGVVAFPCTIQQQVLVEGLPVREPRLPFCGVGVGWAL
ncbi:60S ribosomal protein L18a-1 [Hordeum vulgare]|nr:60S ribosomal protein L18a-1 [Hordeum vulgare]